MDTSNGHDGSPPERAFGTLLRYHRLSTGLTQEELAERAGVSRRSLSDMERGVPHIPRGDTVILLADALALSPTDRTTFQTAARRLKMATFSDLTPPVESLSSVVNGTAKQPSIFVTYSRDNSSLVTRLLAALDQHGHISWLDRYTLRPGTADWEEAIRDAIRTCSVILLVASPESRISRDVKAELAVAEMYCRPILPVWAAGEQWLDSVPFALSTVKYIDARGSRYVDAIDQIVAELHRHAALNRDVAVGTASDVPTGERPATTSTLADLRQASIADHRGELHVLPRNPYKGLQPFIEEDDGDFFGRTSLVASLLEALRAMLASPPANARRLLTILGPSGSGKSSLVRAGLLPHLKNGALPGSAAWVYLDAIVPGPHPLEALTIALASKFSGSLQTLREDLTDDSGRSLHLLARRLATHPHTQVVLVIDQFEELFTLTTSETERRQFIDLLVTAVTEPAGPLLAILTLRADFYDRPMAYLALAALIEANSKAVLPMTLADLREAIERPATLSDVQLAFEPGLVGDLLYEVNSQAGALPLLEFTLDQLVARREGRTLTLAAYQEIGGVRGALTRHAEATYAALPSGEHRWLGRALFLRLIDPGATEQDTTRRRAALSELVLPDPAQTTRMREVIAAFVTARLLTTAEYAGVTTVEVSHEALIREWPRLGEWLHDAREDIRLQQTISADTAAWVRRGHPVDNLYRGSVLQEARAWAGRNIPSTTESAFLEAGEAEERRQAAAQQERQARELALARQAAAADRRAATRSRTLAGVLGLFLLVAVGLTALALHNASTARDASTHASTSALLASQARATAVAERNQALASADDANRARTQAVTARNVALSALSAQLATQAVALLRDQPQLALLLSAQAARLASPAAARVSLLRVVQGNARMVRFLTGHTNPVNSVAFSPDGKLLASGSNDDTIRLWDMATGQLRGVPLTGHTGFVTSVAFSPNGKNLASGSWDTTIRLWDVATGRPLGPPLSGHRGIVTSVAFSPDGKLLAANTNDNTVQLWDVARRQRRGPVLIGHTDTVNSVAFSPNGQILASGSSDGTIRLWDVVTGRPLGRPLTGHTGSVNDVAFSPNGQLLASGSTDFTVRLWDVTRRQPRGLPLTGHTRGVTSVAFSPDGKRLASGSNDNTIRLWNVAGGLPLGGALTGHTDSVNDVTFSRDGKSLASASNDDTIRLWNVSDDPPLGTPIIKNANCSVDICSVPTHPSTGFPARYTNSVNSVAFNPDGRILAYGNSDSTIKLWDLVHRRPASLALTGHTGPVNTVAFSPNGKILASGSSDHTIRLWDISSGRPRSRLLIGHTDAVVSVAFSPDGTILASGSSDGTVRLWDVTNGHPLKVLAGKAIGYVAVSPNGKLLAYGNNDNTIGLWDVANSQPIFPPLFGDTSTFDALAFSPNGKILASSGDSTITLWDVASSQPLGPPLIGHTDLVTSMAFSPDGALLASSGSSGDRTIRLWDVASRQPLGPPLTGYTDAVVSVAFSPDGTILASGSADQTVRLWNLDPVLLAQQACRIANRNMTLLEWRQYLGDEPYQKTCPDIP